MVIYACPLHGVQRALEERVWEIHLPTNVVASFFVVGTIGAAVVF